MFDECFLFAYCYVMHFDLDSYVLKVNGFSESQKMGLAW
jgi:hypothetical protein